LYFHFEIFLQFPNDFWNLQDKRRGQTPKKINNIWYVASRDQYATFKTPSYLKFTLFKKIKPPKRLRCLEKQKKSHPKRPISHSKNQALKKIFKYTNKYIPNLFFENSFPDRKVEFWFLISKPSSTFTGIFLNGLTKNKHFNFIYQ
jgi:hypothetical protein